MFVYVYAVSHTYVSIHTHVCYQGIYSNFHLIWDNKWLYRTKTFKVTKLTYKTLYIVPVLTCPIYPQLLSPVKRGNTPMKQKYIFSYQMTGQDFFVYIFTKYCL